jgi:hypothetical protein
VGGKNSGRNEKRETDMADGKIDETNYVYFKVRVFAHNVFTRFSCVLCGGIIEKEGVSAVLEGYTEDREKKADFGDICRECLDAGREGASERMHHKAGHLREHAEWLEQLAGDVIRAESWASSDDLDSARRDLDNEMGIHRRAAQEDIPF